jgi:hypothetical protein
VTGEQAAYEPPDFEGHEITAIVLPRPTVQAALDLLGYVGDHGGGERRHMIGDRPAPVDTACPSCRANLLADELREAL